jgi:hypothetical protein
MAKRARRMMAGVQKNVGDGVLHLVRSLEGARMEAVREHAAAPAGEAVEAASEPDLESADAAPKRRLVVGFDEEMEVIALEREVDDAKASTRSVSRAQRVFQGLEPELCAEIAELPHDPKRRMNRVPGDVIASNAMRNVGPLSRQAGTAGALASAAPAWVLGVRVARSEGKLDRCSNHLELGQTISISIVWVKMWAPTFVQTKGGDVAAAVDNRAVAPGRPAAVERGCQPRLWQCRGTRGIRI